MLTPAIDDRMERIDLSQEVGFSVGLIHSTMMLSSNISVGIGSVHDVNLTEENRVNFFKS